MYRQVTANNLELKEYPFLRELAMEAYLMENEEVLRLDGSNYCDVTVLDAEISFKSEEGSSSRDGRIDILAKYGMDHLAIVELKLHEINEDTLLQLENYLESRNDLLVRHPEFWTEDSNEPKWVGVLVGTSISPELQRKLNDGYTFNGIPIAGLVVRRFRGASNDIFVTTDTFFNYNYTNKDFTKFEFEGQIYNKGRLVNRVLKTYVEKNLGITYSELEQAFPSFVQGSMGVFVSKDKSQEIFDRTGHKRYYIKPDELIKLSDTTISTCTQWGYGNIVRFVDHVNNMSNDLKIISK